MDGWIRIGTKLDDKELNNDLKKLQQQLKSYERQAEKLTKTKAKIELDLRPYEEEKRLIQEMTNEQLKYAQNEQEVNEVLSIEERELNEIKLQYSQQLTNLEKINQEIKENKNNQKATTNEIGQTTQKIEQLKRRTEGLDSLNNKTFNKGISKIKKFGLALFSIRGIYSLISKASSAYLSQDTELAQKLQSVWTGLGAFLQPLIEGLSNILLKGLGYLNEFIKALTGIDFIANANAKALKNQANAQKQLNNQTAGFDEMNVLQDTSSSAGGGVSSSGLIEIPELDEGLVKKLQDLAYWLEENWDWILLVGGALLLTFGAVKIAEVLGGIGSLLGSGALGTGLLGLLAVLSAIAIIWSFKVIWDNFNELKKQLDVLDSSSKNLRKVIEVTGDLAEKTIKDEKTTRDDLIQTMETQYKVSKDAVGQYEKNMTEARKYSGVIGYLSGSTEKFAQNAFVQAEAVEQGRDAMKQAYDQGKLSEQGTQNLIDLTWSYNQTLERQIKENLANGDSVKSLIEKYNQNNQVLQQVIEKQTQNMSKTERMNYLYGILSGKTGEAKKGFENLKTSMDKVTDKNIKLKVDAETYEAENKISNLFSKLTNNKAVSKTLSLFGIDINSLKTTRLAVGGIVNSPGRGVPIGGAIAGEVYKEGVIPLTDSQAMEELGATIGKYISISATVPVYVGNRQIAREIKKINAENDFATNN